MGEESAIRSINTTNTIHVDLTLSSSPHLSNTTDIIQLVDFFSKALLFSCLTTLAAHRIVSQEFMLYTGNGDMFDEECMDDRDYNSFTLKGNHTTGMTALNYGGLYFQLIDSPGRMAQGYMGIGKV